MPANREADTKHGVTFWLCKAYDLPDNLEYYLIRANEEILSQIGANVFGQGARFPGLENDVRQFPYNDDARAKLQYLGLELMGAYVLSFTSSIDNSPDASYHLTWQPDALDKGHWNIELLVPSDDDGMAITSVEASTLDCGESATLSLVDGVLHLGVPRGCNGIDGDNGLDGTDGADGSDGREIELRVDSGYIQWRYVGDAIWINLLSTASLKGDKGDTGDKGDKGDTGDMGLQGIQGETGPQGEPGIDGAPCDNCPPSTPATTATTGEDTRCNVADGVATWAASKCTDVFNQWSADAAASMLLVDTLDDLLSLFPIIGEVWHVFLQFATDVNTIGIATAIAELTTDFKAEVVCLLHARLGTDGAMTDTVISNWITDVSTLGGFSGFGPIYAKFLGSLLPNDYRKIALIYQHVTGACGCIDQCPDGSTWHSFINLAGTLPACLTLGYGSHTAGTGVYGTTADGATSKHVVQIIADWAASATITRLHFVYDAGGGSGENNNKRVRYFPSSGFWTGYGSRDNLDTGTFLVKEETITQAGAYGAVFDLNSGTIDNQVLMRSIIICGTGTKPAALP